MTSVQIAPRLPSQQSRGASVALGLFDGVHVGHAAVIRQAVQAAGGELVPCVFTFELRETVPDSKNQYSELLAYLGMAFSWLMGNFCWPASAVLQRIRRPDAQGGHTGKNGIA